MADFIDLDVYDFTFLDKKIKNLKKEYNPKDKYSIHILHEINFLKALKKVYLLQNNFTDFGFRLKLENHQCQIQN
jgi:ribonucleotide reductase alpha subunit